ncbi:MAG: adenylate kinase [Flammeovirgaceae bacterium]|nr:adenylate kinase [Flammeovirgaceae bacterium]MDW8286727.1 adenylate kinase [Flammeovirgaceae bacterium]
MINLVLFGPPGAGKGTQSEKIKEKYQLVHLSTGDLLRAQIAAGTTLGLKAKELMDKGILVPDEVVIGMIDDKIRENNRANGFIFDGFPRTEAQAKALDELMERNRMAISGMVALEVETEELVKRLLLRGQTSNRPDDKDERIIRQRVKEYHEKTTPVAAYYKAQGKFHPINGIGEIDEIFANICKILDKWR